MRRTVLNYKYRGCHLCAVIPFLASLLLLLPSLSEIVTAQAPPITPSGGLNTQVSAPLPAAGGETQYDITGGTRPGGGANLFHSFGDFNVPNNNIANFLNDSGLATSNILGRVTEGNISNIFGTIQTTGFGNANLFLMNPTGFLFGPNATVNVGGMVAFTSADYLRLAELDTGNAGIFHADPAQSSVLTNAPIAAFGFLGSNPGAITVQGSRFSVTDGKSISLIGGNITIQSGTPDGGTAQPARLSAPNGNILLASATSPGEFDTTQLQPLPNVDGTSFSSFGSVSLAPGSSVDASGTSTVSIRNGQFMLSVNDAVLNTANSPSVPNTFSLNSGSSIVSSNSGTNLGADIEIAAGALQIDGAMVLNNTLNLGSSAGGNIFVNANSVTLQQGGTLSAKTSGTGDAGNIRIVADQVSLTDLSIVTTSTSAQGEGGTIRVSAEDTISMVDSFISANSNSTDPDAGSGGKVTLTAPTINVFGGNISTLTLGSGNAGDIQIQTGTLRLGASENASGLVEATTSGSGHGGNISILGIDGPGSRANDVTLSDFSSLRSETIRKGAGTAGNITVDTVRLALSKGSEITTASHLNSAGNAGNVTLDANESVLVSGSFVTSDVFEASTGKGGQVIIKTPNLIVNQRSDGTHGQISTSTGSSENAGSVTINADSVTLTNGGRLTSSSFLDDPIYPPATGAAGNVVLQGLNGAGTQASSITINGQDGSGAASGIFTNTDGSGRGGSIALSANSVTLQQGGTLSAKTSGTGDAGNIRIVADQVSLTDLSIVTTSTSAQGEGGTIRVSAEDTISMVDSFISANSNSTDPDAGSGGKVTLTAPTINVFGGNISTLTLGSGNAGDIQIQTGTLRLGASENASGLVEATTSGSGHGGNISILGIDGPGSRANDVTLSDFSSLRSETIRKGAGTAGNITVDTVRLALSKGSEITTASHLNSAGNAGNVTLDANESVLVSGSFVTSDVFEASTGKGGQVIIKTPNLIVNQRSDGTHGQISTSTGSSENAGSVTINADSVTLTNGGRLTSSSFLDDPIYPPATGAAGNVVLQGLNGAGTQASSITINGQDGSGAASGIFTNTDGSGRGGSIALSANSVTLQQGGTLSAATSGTSSTAIGGTIMVKATNTVTMNSASITASSKETADAGNIDITSPNGFTMQNSTITTEGGPGASGGDIKVTTAPSATMLLENSKISASVADGRGGGGNISIDPQYVILQNSQILAQAAQGQGGKITITTNLFLPDANSIVNADSGSGVNGTVTIQSPNAPISGHIQPLGASPLLATSLLNQRCASLAGGEFSSFTVAGRDSLPTEPGSWLASPLATLDAGMGLGAKAEGVRPVARGDGLEGDAPILSLRKIAPAGFLTQAFAVERSSGCQS